MNNLSAQNDVEFVRCDCCRLSEECTLSYIEAIRQRYGGKWICGLCEEAVKDEANRCQKLITLDEAIARHLSFCSNIQASRPPQNPTIHLIRAMRQKQLTHKKSPTTVFRQAVPSRRRRRRMPTVRLGGKKPFFLSRFCRRLKLKCMKSNYLQELRKLKRNIVSLLTGPPLATAGAPVESYHQMMMMEASFGFAPAGLWLIGYPRGYT